MALSVQWRNKQTKDQWIEATLGLFICMTFSDQLDVQVKERKAARFLVWISAG